MVVPQVLPFIRFIKRAGSTEPDALLGFSLPFLPDMLTSPWLSASSFQGRLDEALKLQLRLISRFWNSGVTAWDLRFVGTDDTPGVGIGLLCRISRPSRVPIGQMRGYCLDRAAFIQQLFADFGYELSPLLDEASLNRYLSPFRFQALGELRRYEGFLSVEDTYTEYEYYVPYPWHWASQSRLRLFEALLQRRCNCLVSVCLEPTQLAMQEQRHLSHGTSTETRNLLQNVGSQGELVYNIYREYARSLHQPYLLRIALAASTYQTLEHIGWRFRDELNSAQVIEPVGRAILNELHTSQLSGTGPVLDMTQNQQEWERASHSLLNLTWVAWGRNAGMALPGTARLRYLVDDVAASMAFRLPVARDGDVPGVPIRSLNPTADSSFHSSTTVPATKPSLQATPSSSDTSTIHVSQAAPSTSAAFSIQKPRDLIGKTLGTCQIDALLGQGGCGAVYRAKQAALNRYVAVKVIVDTLTSTNPETRRKMILRFDHEAQAVAQLDHPHILALYDYQLRPLPYLVMPYITGGSLADERKASGHRPLPASGVATMLQQVASALDHAHQHRLIHRDIKPHNLLRHQDGRILLADFGIVQFADEEHTALTKGGEDSPYTPGYASPEQLQGLALDARSDIYSLGVVVYELLCGQKPFSGSTREMVMQHVQASPPPMQSFGVQIHPAIEAVVTKALAKQPGQRYSSAGEMATAFQMVLKSG